ncbi:hypothetical protein ACFX13_013270 [Malus domestica]
MVLDLDVNDYDVFLKYIRGIANYIRKEMNLFTVDTIEEATIKVIAIEAKNKRYDKTLNLIGRKKGKESKKNPT